MKVMTHREREEILQQRIRTLNAFAKTKSPAIIERAAYGVLEAYRSRPQAIAAYITFALKEWASLTPIRLRLHFLYFWFRKIRRLSVEATIERIEAMEHRRDECNSRKRTLNKMLTL